MDQVSVSLSLPPRIPRLLGQGGQITSKAPLSRTFVLRKRMKVCLCVDCAHLCRLFYLQMIVFAV